MSKLLHLSFGSSSTPCALAVIKMCGIEATCSSDASAEAILTLPSGQRLHGDHVIARFLGRTHAKDLYGNLEADPVLAAEVDQYLAMAHNYLAVSSEGRAPVLQHLESRLSKRTFVVGHSATLADLALWTLLSGQRFEEDENPNLCRWQRSFSTLPALQPLLQPNFE